MEGVMVGGAGNEGGVWIGGWVAGAMLGGWVEG